MKTINTLLGAALALTLLGTAAEAQPYRGQAPERGRAPIGRDGEHRGPMAPIYHRGDRLMGHRATVASAFEVRRFHLGRAVRGTHWVRVNNQFLLVNIRTGLIRDVLTIRT